MTHRTVSFLASHTFRWLLAPLLVAFVSTVGCRSHDTSETLDAVPAMSTADELKTLIARSNALHTASGTGSVILTRPDGESVTLDAVAVMAPPDQVHLRATKLGHVVFDLTRTPDGLFLETGNSQKEVTAGATAAEVTKGLTLLSGKFFADPAIRAIDAQSQLFLTLVKPGEPTITCDVDRTTLTARRYQMVDSSGKIRFTLTLSEYDTQAGAVWPRKLTAVSDSGTIVVQLEKESLELNGELSSTAFVPPASAKRVP